MFRASTFRFGGLSIFVISSYRRWPKQSEIYMEKLPEFAKIFSSNVPNLFNRQRSRNFDNYETCIHYRQNFNISLFKELDSRNVGIIIDKYCTSLSVSKL